MDEPAFTALIRNRIHECAPDHSVETISVGELRRAAGDMAALYGALDIILSIDGKHLKKSMNLRSKTLFDIGMAALKQARGEQP